MVPRPMVSRCFRRSLPGIYLLHAYQQPQTPEEWERWLRVTRKSMTRKPHHRPQRTWRIGRTENPTHSQPLPSTASCQRWQWTSNSACPNVFRACLSRDAR
jgi:hypothetical protein